MRLRLCGGRAVSEPREPVHTSRPDLPSVVQSQLLAQWLAGPRSRALRRASIGLRRRVLEVGSGQCVVTPELQRRARGTLISLDLDVAALQRAPVNTARVAGDCRQLPFRADPFDLVFFQNTLMWVSPLNVAVQEAVRVLEPGGVLVAIEPDYGGMMEHPDTGLQELWLSGLSRAGADPQVGRKLPGVCEAAGLKVWVELVHLPQPAHPEAVRLLDDLPLTTSEQEAVRSIADRLDHKQDHWSVFIHVPYFLVVGSKS